MFHFSYLRRITFYVLPNFEGCNRKDINILPTSISTGSEVSEIGY